MYRLWFRIYVIKLLQIKMLFITEPRHILIIETQNNESYDWHESKHVRNDVYDGNAW